VKINYKQYLERAEKLATVNTEPSETDQTGADDTDINVIVKRYGVYGTVPSGNKPPQFGQDTTEYPTELAEAIEIARSVKELRQGLPEKLRTMDNEELMLLTPEQIAGIINPASEESSQQEKPSVGKSVEQKAT